MPVPASRRWLLAAVVLAAFVAAALGLKSTEKSRADRATRSSTDPTGIAAPQEEPPTAPAAEQAADPADEKEWRLEVEVRDESDKPIAGRVYVTSAAGELLSVIDNEATVPAVHKVRGVVNVVAQGPGFGLAPRFLEGIAAPTTGIRRLRVRLETGLEIAGKLVDDAGDPLRFDAIRLQIRAEPVDAPWLMPQRSPSWRNVTDGEGHWIAMSASRNIDSTFKITGLPPGLYRLRADTTCAESLLAPEEPPLARAGARDVVLVLRRAVEIRIRFTNLDTGQALDEVGVGWQVRSEDWELLTGGSGSYGGEGLVLFRPRGTVFTFQAEAESHETPPPLRVSVNNAGDPEELTVGFRREAGGMADLELLVRDDAGQPAFPLMVGRASSSRRYSPRDGRYVLNAPAGAQRIELRSPGDQILLFKREWIPSMHDPDDFPQARAYLPLDVEIEAPRGGRATREVTIQRAALIWVRKEPKGSFSGVRLMQGDAEVEHALRDLYEDKGLVAAVEPGTYTVEGKADEKVVKVEVEAKAVEVAEVWLRANGAK